MSFMSTESESLVDMDKLARCLTTCLLFFLTGDISEVDDNGNMRLEGFDVDEGFFVVSFSSFDSDDEEHDLDRLSK